MRRSLSRHGQLTPVVAFEDGDQLEILDGFNRVHAARTLGWSDLSAKMSEVDLVEAKTQLVALHDRRGLTEIEEAWLVRSLYRDDGLSPARHSQSMHRARRCHTGRPRDLGTCGSTRRNSTGRLRRRRATEMSAWRKAGTGFAGVGGVMYTLTPNMDPFLEVGAIQLFALSGTTISPALGWALGL